MKRWILPIFVALAVHLAVFHATPAWSPPQVHLPQNRTVTLSLAQLAPRPVARTAAVKPVPHRIAKPAPKPAQPPVVHKKPQPQLQPKVRPEPMAPASPAPPADRAAADPPKDQFPVPSAEPDQAPQLPVAPPGPDQARVQASVPLYHLNPAPAYPAVARRRNFQGTVLLDVLVDRQGRASQVNIFQSSGYAVLDRSARNSVRQWRFTPARRFGQSIEMWVQVPVRFELK